MENLPGTNLIVYPQEIWSGCAHRGSDQLSVISHQ